ncbi:MAG: C2H2-type zinc finger protein [Candidatus Nitrosopolaris sp.]
MVLICKDCGQKFLSSSEYKRHQKTHLQTHLDRWSSKSKPDKVSWIPPEEMNQDLLKIFEKYRLGERAMLCLWVNDQLNTAIREPSRILELQDRLKEWLQLR